MTYMLPENFLIGDSGTGKKFDELFTEEGKEVGAAGVQGQSYDNIDNLR